MYLGQADYELLQVGSWNHPHRPRGGSAWSGTGGRHAPESVVGMVRNTHSSLESHLRQLCQKHEISTERDVEGSVRYKKADLLNSELVSNEAYSKLDQKSVTAWLDLRNKAAHGKYEEYEKEQVSIMIAGIRDFLVRNPA